MKLETLIAKECDNKDSLINYYKEYLEFHNKNERYNDNRREGVVHNGSISRKENLTGEELLEDVYYVFESINHDMRVFLIAYNTLDEAKYHVEEWIDNPYTGEMTLFTPTLEIISYDYDVETEVLKWID